MFKLAFSTLACPHDTLEQIAANAAAWEFDGIEFRSNGSGDTTFAHDPALTDPEKVRATLRRYGIENAGLATGCVFDQPVFPPVLGHFFLARHAPVNDAKHMVDIARDIHAPTTRVFAFEIPKLPVPIETRRSTIKRIAERLKLVCDHARHRRTTVTIENGGAFASYEDLIEIINRVDQPNLAACYDLLAAHTIGDDIVAGIQALDSKLVTARLRDRDLENNLPVPLGTGDLPAEAFVQSLIRAGFTGWLNYEWEAGWLSFLEDANTILPSVPAQIAGWAAQAMDSTPTHAA